MYLPQICSFDVYIRKSKTYLVIRLNELNRLPDWGKNQFRHPGDVKIHTDETGRNAERNYYPQFKIELIMALRL